MSYATLDDLIARAGEDEILSTADRDRDGVADAEVVSAALANADNAINGYVGAKYTLPLPSVPDLVRTWAVSIGRYYLHRYEKPDYVRADYEDTIAALKDVAAGKITLQFPADETPAPSSGEYLVSAPEPFFGCNTLRGW